MVNTVRPSLLAVWFILFSLASLNPAFSLEKMTSSDLRTVTIQEGVLGVGAKQTDPSDEPNPIFFDLFERHGHDDPLTLYLRNNPLKEVTLNRKPKQVPFDRTAHEQIKQFTKLDEFQSRLDLDPFSEFFATLLVLSNSKVDLR